MNGKLKKVLTRYLSLAVAVILTLSAVYLEGTTGVVTVEARSFITVKFESNGGSAVADQSHMIGETITEPEAPTKDGAVFIGWFKEAALVNKWDFAKDVLNYSEGESADTIILYAGWETDDIEITPDEPTLASTTAANNRAGTFAGMTVTHTDLTRDNLYKIKVFYTEDGSDPSVKTGEDGMAAPDSDATKELAGHPYYAGFMNRSEPAAEWKIRDAVCGKTYKVLVTSLSGKNRSAVATRIHTPDAPITNSVSGAWKTGYLKNVFFDNYQKGSDVYYTMGLAPVGEDGTVSAEDMAKIPDPTTESSKYNPETGIALMDGRSETQAVVVKAIAAVTGYTTAVSSYYYYNQDNLTMLTEITDDMNEEEKLEIINKVIDSMTLYELTQMTGGGTSQKDWYALNIGAEGRTWGVPRLGIPQNMLSDGPAGLRHKKLSTVMMSWAGLASTWDVDAYEAAGELVGNEAKYYAVDIVLAPGLNIQRNPLGGRNFEYMSEDPLVSGEAASGYIRGIQSKGIGVAAKHFAANEQETNRQRGNSIVSERALREIYLAPFERVVQDDPWTIMTSYNKINGTQTANSSWLLGDVARNEWGFKGYFMTDWGGVETGAPLIEAGNDMQQSGNSGAVLRNWINGLDKDGNAEEGVTEAEKTRRLNRTKDAVRNILKGVIKTPSFRGEYDDLTQYTVNSRSYDFYTNPDSPYADSKAKNFELASGGIVLMKNDNQVLPRTEDTRFAIVSSSIARTYANRGATWGDPGTSAVHDLIIEGGGSGHVYFNDVCTVKEALEEQEGYSVPYAAVDSDIAANAAEEASRAVAATDVGIMIFSRSATEGSDNAVTTYALSDDEKTVLEAFGAAYKAANKPLICLINSGSAMSVVEMNENASAILDVWMPGSQGPNAIAAIIKGQVNPSGKLAQGFPVTYEDSPSIIMGNKDRDPVNSWGTNPVFYDEGVFVGYRYFDTFGGEGLAYPFGHGLSYTTFGFSDLKLSKSRFGINDETITASVKVTNTGDVAGREVAQLYIGADSYKEEGRPLKELKGYVKTKTLKPGESQVVEFTIDKRDLQYFDDGEDPMGLVLTDDENTSNVVYGKGKGWTVKEGTLFTVTVGDTSDGEVLTENGVTTSFTYGDSEDAAMVSLNKSELKLYVEETETLTAVIDPADYDGTLTWASDNEAVAFVDENGKVTAKGVGTAEITVTLSNGRAAACKVTVVDKDAEKLAQEAKDAAEKAKKEAEEAKKKAEEAERKAQEAEEALKKATEENKKELQKVADAAKEALEKAEAKLEALRKEQEAMKKNYEETLQKILAQNGANNNQSAKCTISTPKKTYSVKAGKKVKIGAKVKNRNGAKVTYKSSNKKIAKVNSSGKVTGVKKGTVKITISCNGTRKVVKVKVK